MKVLILDDSANDRAALRDDIADTDPKAQILEAANLREWHEHLASAPDILFQDIRLDPNADKNGSGLSALLEIIDEYPSLPVVICTGYFQDHINEFLQNFLGETQQIVHFLDKASINIGTLKHAFGKAGKYRELYAARSETLNRAETLLKEREAQAQRDTIAKSKTDQAEIFRKAFSGTNWAERVEYEAMATNGTCTMNFLLLSTMLEERVKKFSARLAAPDTRNILFGQRLEYLRKSTNLGNKKIAHIHETWGRRNRIVHMKDKASLSDGRAILQSINMLTHG